MVTTTKTTRAPELLRARTTLSYVLEALERLDEWAASAAEVSRRDVPEYADLLDRLRDEIRAARSDHEMGTPAVIARVVRQLLGEAPPDPDDPDEDQP